MASLQFEMIGAGLLINSDARDVRKYGFGVRALGLGEYQAACSIPI